MDDCWLFMNNKINHATTERDMHDCPELQILLEIKDTMQQIFMSNCLLVVIVGGVLP